MSIKNLLRLNSLFQHDFGAVPCSNETRLKSVTLAKTNMEATGHVKNCFRVRGKDIKLSHVVQRLDIECYPADECYQKERTTIINKIDLESQKNLFTLIIHQVLSPLALNQQRNKFQTKHDNFLENQCNIFRSICQGLFAALRSNFLEKIHKHYSFNIQRILDECADDEKIKINKKSHRRHAYPLSRQQQDNNLIPK